MNARSKMAERRTRQLTAEHEETLLLYSQGKIGTSEAKAELACDFRELIALVDGFTLYTGNGEPPSFFLSN
ncbi:MAG: hypothetical protein K9J77_02870 [Rhodoferax sp.]|nr:hypothetical protein [Rhodoferax sp.]